MKYLLYFLLVVLLFINCFPEKVWEVEGCYSDTRIQVTHINGELRTELLMTINDKDYPIDTLEYSATKIKGNNIYVIYTKYDDGSHSIEFVRKCNDVK
jgi:hypothetical protein